MTGFFKYSGRFSDPIHTICTTIGLADDTSHPNLQVMFTLLT